jgi:hypothetical protein
MAASGGRDIAVFDWHPLAGLLKQELLVGPNMRGGNVERENPAFHCLDTLRQPRLEPIPRLTLLAANPISDLRENYRARVTFALLTLDPCDDRSVPVCLHRLAQYVRIQ